MSASSPAFLAAPAGSGRTAAVRLAAGNLLLGTLGVFIVESGQGAVTVAFYRCLVGAVAMALYCRVAGVPVLTGLDRRGLALAVLTGALMAGNWVLFAGAVVHIGIALATIVFHVQPFLVVLLGALVFGERLTPARLAWVALAFAGLLAAIGVPGAGPEILSSGEAYGWGIACALGGAFLYAWVTLLARRLTAVKGPALTLLQCLVGVPLLALLGPTAPTALGDAWPWLAGIGLVHTGLVYALIYGALPGLATPVIAVLTSLYPASAVLVDGLMYGHFVDLAQAGGLVLIVAAGLGVTLGRSPLRPSLPRPSR